MARRRRKARKAVKTRRNPRRRARRVRRNGVRRIKRRARRLRANPSPIRRRRRRNGRRRLRRNGVREQRQAVKLGLVAADKPASRKRRRRVSKKVRSARRRRTKTRRKLLAQVRVYRKRAKRAKPRSLRRTTAMVQYRRAQGLRRVALRRGVKAMRHSSLARAMHLKTNPGFAGLIVAAKVLAPQVGVGAIGMVALAMGGAKLSSMVVAKAPPSIQPYVPALSTAVLSAAAYLVLDKVAPKYKGVVAIGGMLAAVLQAIVASSKIGSGAAPDSIQAKIKGALLGEYTTVGGGIFRGTGEYTSVGMGEYTSVGTGGDNMTEWASDSLHGLDDATQWAAGEGGVLSGGMFR